MRLKAIVLLATLTLGATAPASETPPPPGTPEGLLSFARALLAGRESFRAVTEFQRFLYHYPEHGDVPEALEGLGKAYAIAGRWEEASAAFGELARRQPTGGARWLLGSALYQAGDHREAAETLLTPETGEPGAVLGTLALLRAGADTDSLPEGARSDLVSEFRGLHRKSPRKAGTFAAILPGAGHLYCERPRDALISLVLNGAFLWGTIESARREQWALAGVLGFFEAGWYSGNVVSAVNAAHKWNRREEGNFLRFWEGEALPAWGVSAIPGGINLGLAWHW